MWEYVSLLAPAPHRMDGQLEKELMGKKMDRIPLNRLEKMVDSDVGDGFVPSFVDAGGLGSASG